MTLNSPASNEIDANVLATSEAFDEAISCCIAVGVFVDAELVPAESAAEEEEESLLLKLELMQIQ